MPKSRTVHDRHQAHSLLDLLPEEKLPGVVHLLQALTDPLARTLANARPEDEPISEEEARAVDASKAWLKNHEPIPHHVVLAELGLTREEFDRMSRTPLEPHGSRR